MVNVDWDADILKSKEDKILQSRQDVIYKAPEHLVNSTLGLKYDIWSVGWILYTLCTLNDPAQDLDSLKSFNNWVFNYSFAIYI